MSEAGAEQYYQNHRGIGLGSQFLAVVFDALLCGVLICQLTHWLPDIKHDARHVQLIVGFGVAGAIGSTCFTWGNYFGVFVEDYGSYLRFASFEYLGWYPFFDMLTVIPVQTYFAERSIKINNSYLPLVIADVALILGTMTCALGVVVTTRHHTVLDMTPVIKAFLLSWPTVCTCTHIVLTTSILHGLVSNRQRHATEGSRTNQMIDRLIMNSIESQLPATLFAISAMVVLATHPTSPIVPWIIIVHPKVFIVGCLCCVNSRHTWQKTDKLPFSNISQSSSGRSHSTITSGPATPKRTALEVEIDVESGHPLTEFVPPLAWTLEHDDDFEPAVSAVSLVEPDLKAKTEFMV